jgi:NAD(P)-dependent dehydrogenase (short-subunit alcohol dehydrogenase family)
MELENKVCFIAGASGAIGSAVAERFHGEGAQLAITYFSNRPRPMAQWHIRTHSRTAEFALDVSCRQQVQDVVRTVIDKFDRIDVLVNCTGVLGPIGPTSGVAAEEWVQAIHINLVGSFYLTQAVVPSMRAHSGGKIIHFSGGGAAYARPFYTAYSASKTALVRFTESVAEELRENRIDINTIAPGPVYSRMWDQMRAAGEKGGKSNLEELRKMEETGGVPPERAANLALFLASPRSNGLTGRLISAAYDNWAGLEGHIPELMESEKATLRRVPLV